MRRARPSTCIVSSRRGVLVAPAESKRIIKRDVTDPTSGSLESRRGMPVMPARRGTPVVPAEKPDEPQWIIHVCTPDLTGRSLHAESRRGTLVVPGELAWIIQYCATDATSGSLRKADLTSRSLRRENWRGTFIVPNQSQWVVRGRPADLTSRSLRRVGRAHLSCPSKPIRGL
jgi:hypothetical protein